MSKASKQQMIEREKRIHALMGAGHTKAEIAQILSKEFKVTTGAIEKQYYQILSDMKSRVVEEREDLRVEIAQQLLTVQKNAMQAGHGKLAVDSAMARAKLLGLNEKIESTQKRPESLIFKEKDMSGKLEVVPKTDAAENE